MCPASGPQHTTEHTTSPSAEHPNFRVMPDTPSITINKKMTYRGQPEVWSNTYHFSGTTPANDAAWHALALAIVQTEKGCYSANSQFCGYLGYEAGNEHAVSIKNYLEDGTALIPGVASEDADPAPSDVAVWLRWTTPDRTSRGKRIYLRKYFHNVPGVGDVPKAATVTNILDHGNAMIAGSLPGGVKVCGPQGAVASMPKVAPFFTTRTLKRRGKRPSR